MAVEREQRIKEDTSTAKRNLYCDVRFRPVVHLTLFSFILKSLQTGKSPIILISLLHLSKTGSKRLPCPADVP